MSKRRFFSTLRVLAIEVIGFPEERESFINQTMDKLIPMIPCWVHDLTIWNSAGRDTGDAADVFCEPPYRRASIRIFENFWNVNHDDAERLEMLKHECGHMLIAPLFIAAFDILDSVYPESKERGPAFEMMKSTLKQAWESVASDLQRQFPLNYPTDEGAA